MHRKPFGAGVVLALVALVVAACSAPSNLAVDLPPAEDERVAAAGPHTVAEAPLPAFAEATEPAADGPARVEDGEPAVAVAPAVQPVPAYGVSAGHPAAVEAGMAVLAAGGNAVDAAIATAYAVGVAEPFGSGVGGGGAAVIVSPGGERVAWDYRDVVNASGRIPASEIGIPGFVAGMEALHAEYGTVPMADLIAPAITVAEEGVEAYPMLSDQLRIAARRLPVERLPHFFPGGRPLPLGQRLVQPELADTLRRIAAGGARDFYGGALAGDLAARVDGIDTPSLEAYAAHRREPVAGTFGGYTVVSAPPPLAGATLVQMLQVAEALGIGDHEPGSPDYLHALAMSWRLADHHRTWLMADPAFAEVPTAALTDADRNAALAAAVPSDALLAVRRGQPPADVGGETTHLTVVDATGTVVSMTNTLTSIWGSGRYELGFFLNDQLSNFGTRRANEPPEPGKRAVSSTVPTVLVDAQGRPVLGLGSPGGGRIPMAVAGVIVRWALHGESIADAVAAPRAHLAGSRLHVEEAPETVAPALLARGYTEVSGPPFPYYFGSVQALEVDHEAGVLRGGTDPRREAGWRVEDARG